MSKYYIEFEDHEDLVLPSESLKRKEKRRSKSSKHKRKLKWGLIITFIVLIYLFYNSIILYFLELLKLNPTVYNYYLFMENEIANNTIKGLFMVSVLGSLFFLVLPSEALFIYYLSQTDHFFGLIILLTVLGSVVGLSFNYFFGRLLGERVIKLIFKKNFDKYKEKIDKVGGYVLLFGNILPGPIEVLAVFFGGFKFHYGRFIFLCFIGRLIKYLILFALYVFFWDSITANYDSFLQNFNVLKDLYDFSELTNGTK